MLIESVISGLILHGVNGTCFLFYLVKVSLLVMCTSSSRMFSPTSQVEEGGLGPHLSCESIHPTKDLSKFIQLNSKLTIFNMQYLRR